MSVQSETETALVLILQTSIPDLDAEAGPRTIPEIESTGRYGSVRRTASSGDRLDYGLIEWTEDYAVTLYWSALIDRETCADEWECFVADLQADADLGGTIAGVYDAFVSGTAWGEAHDAGVRTMQATVTVSRVQ
jgi:hypothetical protein